MCALRPEQRGRGDIEQPGGECRIGQLVFGRLLEPVDFVARRQPAGQRVEEPELAEVIAVGDGGGFGRLLSVAVGGGIK